MSVLEVAFGPARALNYKDDQLRELAIRALRTAAAEVSECWHIAVREPEMAAMCLALALHIARGERDASKLAAAAVDMVRPSPGGARRRRRPCGAAPRSKA